MRPSTLVAFVVLFAGLLLPFGALWAQQPTVTTAQAESTRPGVPPAPVPPSETLSWMLAFSVIGNGIIKKIKDSSWFPMFKEGAGRANVVLAAVLAAATSMGIHTEFDYAAGTLLVTGLTWASIAHFGGDWLRQYALQHLTYRAMAREY